MTTKKKLSRRPTKGMMLAVNASIDGDQATVDQIVKEYDLDCAELDERIAVRSGRKYEMARGGRRATNNGPRMRAAGRFRTADLDLQVTIDGRTAVAKLFKIIDEAERLKAEAQQELKRRPPEQIDPVKKALEEIELLRRERLKLEQKIKVAEESLG